MNGHPLTVLLKGALSEHDFGVLEYGFAPHGRDYRFLIEDPLCRDPGTYELTFTHVVNVRYETRVSAKIWRISWTDEFTDYATWKASGEPDGYVFGTGWSLAYPGLSALLESAEARDWSSRLERPMYAASVETDRFLITLVFSGILHRKLSDETGTVKQVLIPLKANLP